MLVSSHVRVSGCRSFSRIRVILVWTKEDGKPRLADMRMGQNVLNLNRPIWQRVIEKLKSNESD